jgi:UDP-N-acetylglucosamine acyltransferase
MSAAPSTVGEGMGIHPTAIVHPDTVLGENVTIGPYAIVGENCTVGDDCVLAPRAVLEKNVRLGRGVKVGIGTVLGGEPQDLKFRGEETWVEIGEGTVIREYTTVNRGTTQSYKTTVGRNCLLMSYVHLGHDCHFGEQVIVSNGSQFAGHVTVEDRVIVSGLCAFHQFVRVGRHAFIGGMTRVAKDAPPFLRASGNPMKLYGLNTIGLQRSGFDDETMHELKRAYRLLFRSELPLTAAIERAREELNLGVEQVRQMLDFVDGSVREGRGVGF